MPTFCFSRPCCQLRTLAAALALSCGALTPVSAAAASPTPGEYRLRLPGLQAYPAVALSTTSLGLGSGLTGTTLAPGSLTVTNQSKTSTGALNVTVSAPFAIATNTCQAGVPAGGTCSVSVRLATTAAGTYSGVLAIAGDATSGIQSYSVSLSATLAAPSVLYKGQYWVEGTNTSYPYLSNSKPTDSTSAYSAGDAAGKYLRAANGSLCATGNYQASYDQSPTGGADVSVVAYKYKAGSSGPCDWATEYKARVYFYP